MLYICLLKISAFIYHFYIVWNHQVHHVLYFPKNYKFYKRILIYSLTGPQEHLDSLNLLDTDCLPVCKEYFYCCLNFYNENLSKYRNMRTEFLGLELREQSADDWRLSKEFLVFRYLRFINSSSSTTHAEPLLVCTRLKYL